MKGLSLVEIIIAMGISITVGLLLLIIMINSLGLFYKESSKLSEGLSANEVLSHIRRTIKESAGIVSSYTGDGVTYTSDSTQIVFKIATIDASNNIIVDTFDYFIYFQDQNKLRFKTFPNALSIRKAADRIFSNSLDSLIFQYQSLSNPSLEVVPTAAAKVKITLTLKQKIGANYETTTNTSEANLRND